MSYNPNDATQVAALKSELVNDPKAYGYPASIALGDFGAVETEANLVRSAEQINQTRLSAADILQAITPTEWTATNMVLLKFQYLQLVMIAGSVGAGHIDLSNGNVKAALDLIFPTATTPATFAALHALYTRSGSRMETLFGAGTYVGYLELSAASRS